MWPRRDRCAWYCNCLTTYGAVDSPSTRRNRPSWLAARFRRTTSGGVNDAHAHRMSRRLFRCVEARHRSGNSRGRLLPLAHYRPACPDVVVRHLRHGNGGCRQGRCTPSSDSEDFACAASQGIAVDILIEPGHPADVILERAASARAGLIVMGTHGTSGFQHLVLGSVTEKVLRKATCPVLTVPARARATSQLPFTRLLCAVDFSDSSLEAVRAAVSLAEGADATLTLIHVLEWPWEEPPAPSLEELPREQAAALAEFRRYLEKSARTRLESLVPDTMQTPRPRIRIE